VTAAWGSSHCIHLLSFVEYATRGHFGGLSLKTIGGWFRGFGPQNSDGGFEEERTTRGSIEEFASRQSYLLKGVVAIR
jgi:hypothetical protein